MYMSMKKKQMCVDVHAYLSSVTHMRQEFTVCQIKSHFSIVCRFYLFPHQYYKRLKGVVIVVVVVVVVVVVAGVVGVYHK